jgi:hypothetical protein
MPAPRHGTGVSAVVVNGLGVTLASICPCNECLNFLVQGAELSAMN